MKTPAAALCFALAWIAPEAGVEIQKEDQSRILQLLPSASEIEPVERELNSAEISQIEKSIGEKLHSSLLKPKIYKLNAVAPEEKEPKEVRVLWVPLEKLKSSVLVLAVNPTGNLVAAQIVQDRTVNQAWKLFLDQFIGPKGLKIEANTLNPPSTLQDKQKKASATGDGEAKKLFALLQHKKLMWDNGVLGDQLFEQIRSRGDRAVPLAKEYAKLLAELDGSSPRLSQLLEPSDLQSYQTRIKELRKTAEQISAQLGKKEWDKALQSTRQSQNQCGKCHSSESNQWKKPLISAFEQMREDLGIGKGYFVLGHDIYLPEAVKKEEAQLVANAIKAGLWVLKY